MEKGLVTRATLVKVCEVWDSGSCCSYGDAIWDINGLFEDRLTRRPEVDPIG